MAAKVAKVAKGPGVVGQGAEAGASMSVVCAMRDLRFVATELKQLQSEDLLPKDTAEKVCLSRRPCCPCLPSALQYLM